MALRPKCSAACMRDHLAPAWLKTLSSLASCFIVIYLMSLTRWSASRRLEARLKTFVTNQRRQPVKKPQPAADSLEPLINPPSSR